MQKGNDSMILYLSASTDLDDLVIDYIEIKLATGETVSLDWDESDIEQLDTGFHARYKGVFFDEDWHLCGIWKNSAEYCRRLP
ncbi:MAG: hypothetical protein HFE65_00100 [Clostridiales bacterium]|jgi:hypothetical protein|nr:hypothetical protein [Clostridiales bacterium]